MNGSIVPFREAVMEFHSGGWPSMEVVGGCKYGAWSRPWTLNLVLITHDLGLWKAIRGGWNFFKIFWSQSGDGRRIRFAWFTDRHLASLFLELFQLAVNKDYVDHLLLHSPVAREIWDDIFVISSLMGKKCPLILVTKTVFYQEKGLEFGISESDVADLEDEE